MTLISSNVADALLVTPDIVRKLVKNREISIAKQAAGGSYEFSLKNIQDYISKNNHKLPCAVISFANIKGGTGKTLFTICIAEVLKYLGYRVLVIDCDKQGNTTMFYLGKLPPADAPSITDIFYGNFPAKLIIPTAQAVDLIPANLQHSQIHSLSSLAAYTNLHDYIDQIKSNYDFILLDTPPDTELALKAPLLASDRTFCIIEPHPSSCDGVDYLYTTVNEINKTFSGRRPVIFKSCIFNFLTSERGSDKISLENTKAKELQREIVYFDRFGKIVNQEKRCFNVFNNYVPGSSQYRRFYMMGASRENPAIAYPFFESHLSTKNKNSFVYVTLEMLAELRDDTREKTE